MGYFAGGYFADGYFADGYFFDPGTDGDPLFGFDVSGEIQCPIESEGTCKFYIGQAVGLATTIKVNGTAQNITDGVVSFEYYVHGNKTNTPTDTIAGGIISASSGTAYAIFPASANTIAGLLRVQVKYIKDGYTYRAGTFSVEVSHKGT